MVLRLDKNEDSFQGSSPARKVAMVAMCEASEASKGWSDDAKGGSPGAAAVQLIKILCLPNATIFSPHV
jgi:hypothetical protein